MPPLSLRVQTSLRWALGIALLGALHGPATALVVAPVGPCSVALHPLSMSPRAPVLHTSPLPSFPALGFEIRKLLHNFDHTCLRCDGEGTPSYLCTL